MWEQFIGATILQPARLHDDWSPEDYIKRSEDLLYKSRKSPVDFEVVTGAGIHPFRLDMTIDQVVEAAKGWVTTKVKRDPALGALHISLRLGRKRLIVGLLDVLLSVSGSKSHYRVYSISSRDAILPDGRRLEKLSAEELVSYFKLSTEELASHPWDDDDNGFSGRHFDSNDKETSIFFWNGERAELTISRIPELG